jgi:hypothetical protein
MFLCLVPMSLATRKSLVKCSYAATTSLHPRRTYVVRKTSLTLLDGNRGLQNFGVSEWSARLGPAICGLLTIAAI